MICVSIGNNLIQDAIQDIYRANEEADMIELRLDKFQNLTEKDLKTLINACLKPIICTCRKLEEGGFFKGTETKRIDLLKKAMKLKADYIDLEFSTRKTQKEKIYEYNKKHKTKIILSKHFFGYTPEFDELKKLMMKMNKEKHDVLKIITKANTQEDSKIMYELLTEARKKGIKLIAFCMGPIGRDSRI